MSKTSGFVHPAGDRAYFFRDDVYVRYGVAADAVEAGYPKPIAGNWPGLFASGIDAALVWPDGSTYFFSGDQYVKFDWGLAAVPDGYPRPIAGSWPGVFDSGIDAAVLWPSGNAYIFKGDQYVRYEPATDSVPAGYPRSIADSWPGLFSSGIEAALVWPSGNVYFFSGDQYVRYDPVTDRVVDGYPQPIAGSWPGLPIGTPVVTPTPVSPTPAVPARAMSKADALAELTTLRDQSQILWAPSAMAGRVDLDGLIPGTATKQDGNVSGVQIRYLESGSRLTGSAASPNAPDNLDPRHALAMVRLCQWLNTTWGASELYHLGAGGTAGREDCHGQGRAMDFVGAKGTVNGGDYQVTVLDDWGNVDTPSTPGGVWQPVGTENTHFRLDDATDKSFERDIFRSVYNFAANQWQDQSAGPDPAGTPSAIGGRSYLMNPDHHTSSPGGKNGREAHRDHLHIQIGPTGSE